MTISRQFAPDRLLPFLLGLLLAYSTILVPGCQAADWSWEKSSLYAYYSYRNAECMDDGYISGTAYMTYDDIEISAMLGIEVREYEGPCLYFEGGSLDIYSAVVTGSAGINETNLFGKGICTECYGLTGCSVDGTCDTFMTYPPNVSMYTGYQLSNNKIDTHDSKVMDAIREPAMTLKETVTYTVIESQESYTSSKSSILKDGLHYYLLGSFIGFAGLVTIVAVLEGLRQRRVTQEMQQQELSAMSMGVNTNNGVPYAFV